MSTPADSDRSRARVLVIDDDVALLRGMARLLGRRYTVVALTSAQAALALLDAGVSFDVILCDVMMPHMTGVGFLSAVERRHPALVRRIAFITGALDIDEVSRFLGSVDNPRLVKPWDPADLALLVEGTVRRAA